MTSPGSLLLAQALSALLAAGCVCVNPQTPDAAPPAAAIPPAAPQVAETPAAPEPPPSQPTAPSAPAPESSGAAAQPTAPRPVAKPAAPSKPKAPATLPQTPAAPAPKAPGTVTAPAAKAIPAAPLDLTRLKEELKATSAIGFFSKLTLKNQMDDLLERFRLYHQGERSLTVTDLRRSYELLVMKVLSLVQDEDQKLAADIVSSREAIWALLADPKQFATLDI